MVMRTIFLRNQRAVAADSILSAVVESGGICEYYTLYITVQSFIVPIPCMIVSGVSDEMGFLRVCT